MGGLKISPGVLNELWVTGSGGKPTIDEGTLAEKLVEENGLCCYNGILYDRTGRTLGNGECQKVIYQVLREVGVTSNLANRVKSVYETVKISSSIESIEVPKNQIAVQNGTLMVNLTSGEIKFDKEEKFSINRLNCSYDPDNVAVPPKRFLEWVDNLIHDYDRDGFQEYLGYCLLPITKLQKAMILLGKGQEGKSRIGLVLQYLFGNSCATSTVDYFENNSFSLPRAENKLVLFQDDLKKDKLKSTEVFKMMVSAEIPLQAEQKHERVYSFIPYARWVICSNAPLLALHDNGHGFFRRLYCIRVKNRPPNRIDDPFYFEPMKDEMDGIFIWMLQGLQRLIRNHWQLSESNESKDLVADQQEQENSLLKFMKSELRFGRSYSVTKSALYAAYQKFCTQNSLFPQKRPEMWTFFEEQLDNLNIRKDKHLGKSRGQEGYVGMCLKSTAEILDLLDGR